MTEVSLTFTCTSPSTTNNDRSNGMWPCICPCLSLTQPTCTVAPASKGIRRLSSLRWYTPTEDPQTTMNGKATRLAELAIIRERGSSFVLGDGGIRMGGPSRWSHSSMHRTLQASSRTSCGFCHPGTNGEPHQASLRCCLADSAIFRSLYRTSSGRWCHGADLYHGCRGQRRVSSLQIPCESTKQLWRSM